MRSATRAILTAAIAMGAAGAADKPNFIVILSDDQSWVVSSVAMVPNRPETKSDYFLMPSRYEPCGLNQMYSLRYGTIPIVRSTGGLKDTIKNLDSTGNKGNGFTFTEYSPTALTKTISKACKYFVDSRRLGRVRERIMREDHSWKRSAGEYLKLYGRARGRIGMRLTAR